MQSRHRPPCIDHVGARVWSGWADRTCWVVCSMTRQRVVTSLHIALKHRGVVWLHQLRHFLPDVRGVEPTSLTRQIVVQVFVNGIVESLFRGVFCELSYLWYVVDTNFFFSDSPALCLFGQGLLDILLLLGGPFFRLSDGAALCLLG